MFNHGKKFLKAKKKIIFNKKYSLKEACSLVLKTKTTKFNESVDVAINLGINTSDSSQIILNTVMLPYAIGKKVIIAVFANGIQAQNAELAGADIVGSNDLAEKIKKGFLKFNKVISTPGNMSIVRGLGKILGPKGLMPNLKLGTITDNVSKVIKEFKRGKIEYKTDKFGILHCSIGRASFSENNLYLNFKALLDSIIKIKPLSFKGKYLQKANISLSMGPNIKLDVSKY